MDHAITVGGLLAFLGLLAGIGMLGIGVLMFLAGAMSDAPGEGSSMASKGLLTGALGVAIGIASLVHLF